MAFALQPLTVNALEPFALRIKRSIDHLVSRLVEARVHFLKSEAAREIAEQLHIAVALTQRRDGLMGDLQMVVAVGSLQFFMLEKSSGGRHAGSVVCGVS